MAPKMKSKRTPRSSASRGSTSNSVSGEEDNGFGPTPPATEPSTTSGSMKPPPIPNPLKRKGVSEQKKKKPKLMAGLESQNVITILDDSEEELDAPRRSRRSSRTTTREDRQPDPKYIKKYHPMDDITRPSQARKVKQLLPAVEISPKRKKHVESEDDSDVPDLHSSSGDDIDDATPSNSRLISERITGRPSRGATQKRVLYDGRIHPQDRSLEESGVIKKKTNNHRLRKSESKSSPGQHQSTSIKVASQRITRHRNDRRVSFEMSGAIHITEKDPITSDETTDLVQGIASSHSNSSDGDEHSPNLNDDLGVDLSLAEQASEVDKIILKARNSSTMFTKQPQLRKQPEFQIHEDTTVVPPSSNRDARRANKALRKHENDFPKENAYGSYQRVQSSNVSSDTPEPNDDQLTIVSSDGGGFANPGPGDNKCSQDGAESVLSCGRSEIFEHNLYVVMAAYEETHPMVDEACPANFPGHTLEKILDSIGDFELDVNLKDLATSDLNKNPGLAKQDDKDADATLVDGSTNTESITTTKSADNTIIPGYEASRSTVQSELRPMVPSKELNAVEQPAVQVNFSVSRTQTAGELEHISQRPTAKKGELATTDSPSSPTHKSDGDTSLRHAEPNVDEGFATLGPPSSPARRTKNVLGPSQSCPTAEEESQISTGLWQPPHRNSQLSESNESNRPHSSPRSAVRIEDSQLVEYSQKPGLDHPESDDSD